MDQHETIDGGASSPGVLSSSEQGLIRPRPRPGTAQRQDPQPIRVLARMPNLESERSGGHGSRRSRRHRREEGRLVRSAVAVPLLVAAGVLLVAAAVVPLILAKKDTADTASKDEAASWHSEPTDAVADAAARLDAVAERDASGGSAPTARIETVTAGPAQFAAPDYASSRGPAAANPGTVQGQASGRADSPQNRPASQAEIASWRDPGRWPYGSGVGQPESASPIPPQPYPQTAGAYPEAAGNATTPYQAGYEASRPAQASYEDYSQPQIGMNHSMALDRQAPAQALGYPAPGRTGEPAGTATPAYVADRYPATSAAVGAHVPGSPRGGNPIAVNPNGGTYAAGTYQAGTYPTGPYQAGTYQAGNDASGTWARPDGPGGARLQGVIEKPSVRMTYDSNRPGVY